MDVVILLYVLDFWRLTICWHCNSM